ncbi:MAG: ABC transporter substrate-binding protein [Roseovarius sp.]
MNKTRRTLSAIATLLASAAATAAPAQEKITFALGTTVIDASQANNTSVPQHLNCWEDAGLDVEIQPSRSSAAVQALVTGGVDFVLAGPAASIVAASKGADVQAVYLNIRKNFVFLTVPEDSDIQSLEDFKGKNVGVYSYGAQQYRVFRGMVAEAGLDPDEDVTWLETGAGAQAVAALESDRVDAWGTWDSQLATAENMGLKFRRFTTPEAEKLNWGSSVFTTKAYADEHKEAVGDFLRCIAEGTAFTIANPEAAIRAHWEIYPESKPSNLSDEEAMAQALNIVNTRMEFVDPGPDGVFGLMPDGSAAATVKFMRDNDILEDEVDPEKLFTNEFVEATNDFDRKAIEEKAKSE